MRCLSKGQNLSVSELPRERTQLPSLGPASYLVPFLQIIFNSTRDIEDCREKGLSFLMTVSQIAEPPSHALQLKEQTILKWQLNTYLCHSRMLPGTLTSTYTPGFSSKLIQCLSLEFCLVLFFLHLFTFQQCLVPKNALKFHIASLFFDRALLWCLNLFLKSLRSHLKTYNQGRDLVLSFFSFSVSFPYPFPSPPILSPPSSSSQQVSMDRNKVK